jgi:hypothetical protein
MDFRSLFVGGDFGYGEWDTQRGAITRRGPAPLSAYEKHLAGELGLGLVPVRVDGTCRFAAVDIDVDTIDHKALYRKVQKRRFPLHVCRSKSGGAHLYMFIQEPGLPAAQVQGLLRRWASILGYPSAEIFPKQSKITTENIGNWINLPYFGSDATTRYEVGEDGSLGFADFLAGIRFYREGLDVDESVDKVSSEMPPCLAALSQQKLAEGSRNVVLFNVAVFYRKSKPSDWEDQVSQHNSAMFVKPLAYREVQAVIKSAGRVRYQYTCEQQPVKGYCNRDLCLTLPFGVGHMPWKEADAYDEFQVGHLRKLLTTPPRYIVEVNGRDLELGADEFLSFGQFRKKVYQALDFMVAPMKQGQWDQQIRELTTKKEDIDAPEDASFKGLVMEKFFEFLSLRERAVNKEDILRGLPVQQDKSVVFRLSDFRRHLQTYKLDKIDGSELFLLLKDSGCSHKRIRVSGKLMTAWAYPLEKTNDQTEDFEVSNFSADLQEI